MRFHLTDQNKMEPLTVVWLLLSTRAQVLLLSLFFFLSAQSWWPLLLTLNASFFLIVFRQNKLLLPPPDNVATSLPLNWFLFLRTISHTHTHLEHWDQHQKAYSPTKGCICDPFSPAGLALGVFAALIYFHLVVLGHFVVFGHNNNCHRTCPLSFKWYK